MKSKLIVLFAIIVFGLAVGIFLLIGKPIYPHNETILILSISQYDYSQNYTFKFKDINLTGKRYEFPTPYGKVDVMFMGDNYFYGCFEGSNNTKTENCNVAVYVKQGAV